MNLTVNVIILVSRDLYDAQNCAVLDHYCLETQCQLLINSPQMPAQPAINYFKTTVLAGVPAVWMADRLSPKAPAVAASSSG
jgi:hypothetical protein